MTLRDDPQLSGAGRTASMPVRAAGNSELHCGLVRAQDPCALVVRGAVHPQTTLVRWQVRGARTAPMAQILTRRCSPCPSNQPRRRYRYCTHHPHAPLVHSADHRLHSMRGRRLSGAAVEAALDGCQVAARGNLVEASRSSRRPPSCYRRAAPVRGGWEGRAQGSDGSKSASQLTPAAWPVRPDPPLSQGGFGARG